MSDSLKKVTISDENSVQNVWYCERKEEWRWTLIWDDGGKFGTHMHSGMAPSETKAREDIAITILWIESKWPSAEYFDGP
jgi:hypothetical protein